MSPEAEQRLRAKWEAAQAAKAAEEAKAAEAARATPTPAPVRPTPAPAQTPEPPPPPVPHALPRPRKPPPVPADPFKAQAAALNRQLEQLAEQHGFAPPPPIASGARAVATPTPVPIVQAASESLAQLPAGSVDPQRQVEMGRAAPNLDPDVQALIPLVDWKAAPQQAEADRVRTLMAGGKTREEAEAQAEREFALLHTKGLWVTPSLGRPRYGSTLGALAPQAQVIGVDPAGHVVREAESPLMYGLRIAMLPATGIAMLAQQGGEAAGVMEPGVRQPTPVEMLREGGMVSDVAMRVQPPESALAQAALVGTAALADVLIPDPVTVGLGAVKGARALARSAVGAESAARMGLEGAAARGEQRVMDTVTPLVEDARRAREAADLRASAVASGRMTPELAAADTAADVDALAHMLDTLPAGVREEVGKRVTLGRLGAGSAGELAAQARGRVVSSGGYVAAAKGVTPAHLAAETEGWLLAQMEQAIRGTVDDLGRTAGAALPPQLAPSRSGLAREARNALLARVGAGPLTRAWEAASRVLPSVLRGGDVEAELVRAGLPPVLHDAYRQGARRIEAVVDAVGRARLPTADALVRFLGREVDGALNLLTDARYDSVEKQVLNGSLASVERAWRRELTRVGVPDAAARAAALVGEVRQLVEAGGNWLAPDVAALSRLDDLLRQTFGAPRMEAAYKQLATAIEGGHTTARLLHAVGDQLPSVSKKEVKALSGVSERLSEADLLARAGRVGVDVRIADAGEELWNVLQKAREMPGVLSRRLVEGLAEGQLERLRRVGNTELVLPAAFREGLGQAVDAAVQAGAPPVSPVDAAAKTLLSWWSASVTRGSLGLKPGYFLNNAYGNVEQTFVSHGAMPALKHLIRTELPNLLVPLGIGVAESVTPPALVAGISFLVGQSKLGRAAVSAATHAVGSGLERLSRVLTLGGFQNPVSDILNARERVMFRGFDCRALYQSALQHGVLDGFDSTMLREELMGGVAGRVQEGFRGLAGSVSTAVSLRQRVGLYVTLMEHGATPVEAAQGVVKALYDYEYSVTAFEKGLFTKLVVPFWRWQKNANRQFLGAMTSPEGAYRVGLAIRGRIQAAEWADRAGYGGDYDAVGVGVGRMTPDEAARYAQVRPYLAARQQQAGLTDEEMNVWIRQIPPSFWNLREGEVDPATGLPVPAGLVEGLRIAQMYAADMRWKNAAWNRASFRAETIQPGVTPGMEDVWTMSLPPSGMEGAFTWMLGWGSLGVSTVDAFTRALSEEVSGQQLLEVMADNIVDPERLPIAGRVLEGMQAEPVRVKLAPQLYDLLGGVDLGLTEPPDPVTQRPAYLRSGEAAAAFDAMGLTVLNNLLLDQGNASLQASWLRWLKGAGVGVAPYGEEQRARALTHPPRMYPGAGFEEALQQGQESLPAGLTPLP